MAWRESNGWRFLSGPPEPGCFAAHPIEGRDAEIQLRAAYASGHPVAIAGAEGIAKRWRCERRKGHKGWHCCDNASWE